MYMYPPLPKRYSLNLSELIPFSASPHPHGSHHYPYSWGVSKRILLFIYSMTLYGCFIHDAEHFETLGGEAHPRQLHNNNYAATLTGIIYL